MEAAQANLPFHPCRAQLLPRWGPLRWPRFVLQGGCRSVTGVAGFGVFVSPSRILLCCPTVVALQESSLAHRWGAAHPSAERRGQRKLRSEPACFLATLLLLHATTCPKALK